MLLCYNKVYLTKIAYESIMKYTDFDKYHVELIIVNNGSDDNGETSGFIAEIDDPRVKTIDLKYPLGYNGYTLGPVAAGGRYFIEFHSDVVATENWLNNLMACITSDPNIGAAVAICNESSNMQMILVNYADPLKNDKEMQRFAKDYNRHDPRLWAYRERLLPTSGYIIPTILYRQILRDPFLYYGQFADDDMSMYLRRSGFMQVLAKDTFLHHFGSQTSSKDYSATDNISKSRQRFYEKWEVDAWSSAQMSSVVLGYLMNEEVGDNKSCLFIDPLFGAIPLLFSNELQKREVQQGVTTAVVSDLRYLADAKYYDHVYEGNVTDILNQDMNRYDYVAFQQDITEYIDKDFPEMLKAIYKVCKPDTKVIFTLKNPHYYGSIRDLLNGIIDSKPFEKWSGVRFIDPYYVSGKASEAGFKCSVGYNEGPDVSKDASYIKTMQTLTEKKATVKSMICDTLLFELTPK